MADSLPPCLPAVAQAGEGAVCVPAVASQSSQPACSRRKVRGFSSAIVEWRMVQKIRLFHS